MLKDSRDWTYSDTDIEYHDCDTIEILFSEQNPPEKGYYKIRWLEYGVSEYFWYWDGFHWFYNSMLLTKVTDTVYSWIGLNYDPNS